MLKRTAVLVVSLVAVGCGGVGSGPGATTQAACEGGFDNYCAKLFNCSDTLRMAAGIIYPGGESSCKTTMRASCAAVASAPSTCVANYNRCASLLQTYTCTSLETGVQLPDECSNICP